MLDIESITCDEGDKIVKWLNRTGALTCVWQNMI